MKYEIVPSNQFKKDLKLAQKRGYDLEKIKKVIATLANGETLEAKYRDHLLTGDYGGYRECHIQPDWLLVYQIDGDQLILFLARTGTYFYSRTRWKLPILLNKSSSGF